MRSKKKADGFTGSSRRSGPFLQPLVVGLVSVILVSLALISGLMDLRTLDKTLVGYLEKRGIEIIRNVQHAAKHNFQVLDYASRSPYEGAQGAGITDEAFSLRESLVLALMDLAQRIDFEKGEKGLDEKSLISTATREGVYILAFVNNDGTVALSNRSVPEDLLASEKPVITGKKEIRVDLFRPLKKDHRLPSLALRRKWGKGSVILALNREDFRFWKARVSLQKAVEEVSPGPDTGYLLVRDRMGRVLCHWMENGDRAGGVDHAGDIPAKASGRSDNDGPRMLEVVAPISLGSAPAFTAYLTVSRATADRMLKQEWGRGIAFMCFMAFITLISMWFLYRSQNRHLARMREMEGRLHHAERLSAMGRLAAGVAHEIRNPLNAISMAVQRLRADNLPELRGVIRDEIQRLNRIVEEFIAFSRVRKLKRENRDAVELVRQVVALMREEADARGISLEEELPRSPLVGWIDFDKMKQALLNIVKNAMESISGQGRITISAQREGRSGVKITVSDTGGGLDPQEVEQIFNPDYTTKEKGLGLGLALSHEIVEGHSGEIRVRSKPGTGTTFEILLPVNPADAKGTSL